MPCVEERDDGVSSFWRAAARAEHVGYWAKLITLGGRAREIPKKIVPGCPWPAAEALSTTPGCPAAGNSPKTSECPATGTP